MILKRLAGMVAVVGLAASGTTLHGQSSVVTVTQTAAAYILTYSDPDFGGTPQQFAVPIPAYAAKLRTTIQPVPGGRWNYAYRVENAAGSADAVGQWTIQVQSGTEVTSTPPGWTAVMDSVGQLTYSADAGQAVAPSATAIGWSVTSDALPAPFQALITVRQATLDVLDVPEFLKPHIRNVEARAATRVPALRPWIATRRATESGEALVAEDVIAAMAHAMYVSPLGVEALNGLDTTYAAAQAARQLSDVEALLREGNRGAAAAKLQAMRLAVAAIASGPDGDRSATAGLLVVIDYLLNRLA